MNTKPAVRIQNVENIANAFICQIQKNANID